MKFYKNKSRRTIIKILLLDIESAPNTAHVWGLWKQNIGLNQILDSGYVLCWAAKWLGKKEIFFSSTFHDGKRTMLNKIHTLLDEADAIVHYNGTKFDIPTLNKEFILSNLAPPAPFKEIDLLKTAKARFKFPSNKLDYIAKALGFEGKVKHEGHELWIKCMNNNPESWEQMMKYNINDVILLEKVYYAILPWIKGHANYALYNTDSMVCPNCGSTHYHKRGFQYTASCKYQRYQCSDCSTWFKGTKNIGPKAGEKFTSAY